MKTGLLFGVAGVIAVGVVGGAANVRAACITTPNCENMGYQYCASECPNGSVACPFDSNKHFCFNPVAFTVTAETCKAECKNVGTNSCTRSGVTYYESCGSSTCTSGQTCQNGTCRAVPKEGHCCGYINDCSYSGGTSSFYDSDCQSHYGMSCYDKCKAMGYPDCNHMQASCIATGNSTPVFQFCGYYDYIIGYPYFTCEMVPTSGDCCGYVSNCDFSGTSSSYDSNCQSHYGMSCYNACKSFFGYPDCNAMQASCRAQGGTPDFRGCVSVSDPYASVSAKFACQ